MHEMIRDETQRPHRRWAVQQSDKFRKSLLRLPTDDFINVRYVDMIRCTAAKADRNTGEVGAAVHIECKGSWFTVRFEEVDEARGFARAVCDFRDEMVM